MSGLCGQIIAGHRVVRLLGRGGMAEVYEVEHLQLGSKRVGSKRVKYEGHEGQVGAERALAAGRWLAVSEEECRKR